MSRTIFFIADTHFEHKLVARLRGYESVEEHDEHLIDQWNATVGTRDTVWLLGDAVFGKHNLWKLGRLNGIKRLVMGNHDCYAVSEYAVYFSKIYGAFSFKHDFILTHVPVHPQQLEKRYKCNIHGHTHTFALDDRRYVGVSVELIDAKPQAFDVVRERVG